MKLFDWFKKRPPKDNISGDEVCRIYYTLRDYQSNMSTNLAVIKNKKKFKWQLKVWKEKMNLARGDKCIKKNDDFYTYIINEQEVNIIYVSDLHNIEERGIKYRKYM